jgi:hypothetical protein
VQCSRPLAPVLSSPTRQATGRLATQYLGPSDTSIVWQKAAVSKSASCFFYGEKLVRRRACKYGSRVLAKHFPCSRRRSIIPVTLSRVDCNPSARGRPALSVPHSRGFEHRRTYDHSSYFASSTMARRVDPGDRYTDHLLHWVSHIAGVDPAAYPGWMAWCLDDWYTDAVLPIGSGHMIHGEPFRESGESYCRVISATCAVGEPVTNADKGANRK